MAAPIDKRLLLVTVAPGYIIRKLADEYGDKLRELGEFVVTDVDDAREVEVADEYVKITVTVAPKKKQPRG